MPLPRILKSPTFLVAVLMLISNLLVYAPFIGRMEIIYRNYDGPFYMYVAKTLYQMPADPAWDDPLKQNYYASHLPAYPLLIRFLTVFTGGNYPWAMLLATIVSSIAAAILFYRVLLEWKLVISPLWTASLFCFFPPRWWIYHSIGATEPLMLCFIFGAFLALRRDKTWLVTLMILLASLTRIMGILLIPTFVLIYIWRTDYKKLPVILLSSLGLLSLFLFYQSQFGDFFAYFRHNLEEKGMITARPFEVFRFYASKINFHTSELYLLLYGIYGMGTFLLWKRRELFIYALIFYIFAWFIYHFDLPRHLIPLAPFAILVSFDAYLSNKAVKLLLVPLFLYLAYVYVVGWMPYPLLPAPQYEQLLLELQR